MKFKELEQYKTTIEDFPLKWRFDSKNIGELASFDDNIIILNRNGCETIKRLLENWNLYSDFPFKKDLFLKNTHFSIAENNNDEIKIKLDSLRFDNAKLILLMWDNETSILTNWRFFINNHSDFFYPGSDDLTVFDETMQWSILLHHSEIVYYSTN